MTGLLNELDDIFGELMSLRCPKCNSCDYKKYKSGVLCMGCGEVMDLNECVSKDDRDSLDMPFPQPLTQSMIGEMAKEAREELMNKINEHRTGC